MKIISTVVLRELEVIDLCGGERLGYPCDFEIDLDNGRIVSLIVTSCDGGFFSKREEIVIPWCKIECIGEDAILVKLPNSEDNDCCRTRKKEKRRGLPC